MKTPLAKFSRQDLEKMALDHVRDQYRIPMGCYLKVTCRNYGLPSEYLAIHVRKSAPKKAKPCS